MSMMWYQHSTMHLGIYSLIILDSDSSRLGYVCLLCDVEFPQQNEVQALCQNDETKLKL